MLTMISEPVFLSKDPVYRVLVHEHPRQFGLLQLPDTPYALTLCWESDMIRPEIQIVGTSIWIGIDQRVVCVSNLGNILFSIGLNSTLLQIKLLEGYIMVLCEIELIIINPTCTIRSIMGLRDIPNSIDFNKNELVITYINGEQTRFPFCP